MNPLEGLAYGFQVALTPDNLVAGLIGAFLGTAVGILPGMGPTVVMAILLVPTMGMKPETGLIMLGAIYYGTQYGDSMSAILMNIPSEPPSVVIAIDGYKAARRGRAGAALSVAAIGSFIGSSMGLIGLALLAVPLGQAALGFGPSEYFALTVVGLVVLSRMTSTSLFKGLVALGLGLALTTVGIEPITGQPRFTFGNPELLEGIDLIPALMGLVGMAEVFQLAAKPLSSDELVKPRFFDVFPTRAEWKEGVAASLRGGFIGFFGGLLPGPTQTLSTFVSYRLEQRLSPETVGKGALRAVSGPKAADDGAISGSLVPLMALGLPFTGVTAVLFAGLMLHGVTPGPVLISQRPEIFWGLVAAMYIGNLALLVLNFPLVGMWVYVLRTPQPILSAALTVLMLVGAYSLRNNVLDMVVVLVIGIMGYVMRQFEYERVLTMLGMVLGPLLEANFRRSLQITGGDPSIFIDRPIPQLLWAILLIVLLAPVLWKLFTRGRRAAPVITPDLQSKMRNEL